MRRVLLLSTFLISIFSGKLWAQERTITGKVVLEQDGSSLPAVNVILKGTTTGTITDVDGNYSLTVPAEGGVLLFNFIGLQGQEVKIGSESEINVQMLEDVRQLTEVVVTGAYGTTRSEKSTTSNAQVVESEKLNVIRQTNINNALAGKVAGLQVRSQSAAALGRQTDVRLRGATGFGSGSGAIYVVDGTILPNSNDINLDDIESVSVLQGPAASALFGSQGANGAIVMTTKKGKRYGDGVGVTLNIGAQFDQVNILPNYQNSYAGGAASELMQYTWKEGDPVEWQALDGKYYHDYSDDASWGPKMEGQEYIPWYAWYGGHSRSYQTATLDPQPNNSRDFFNTGMTFNNTVSISSASDKLTYRLSYGNQTTKGLLPNSRLYKNTLNLNSAYKLNDKLEVTSSINYINQELNGIISDDYGNASTGSFNQWFHRDLDMGILKELRGLQTDDGVYATWNHANPSSYDAANPAAFYGANYWYNFYTFFDNYSILENRDRLFGNIALNYKINDYLSIRGTYRKNMETRYGETKLSSGLERSGNQTGLKGTYGTGENYENRRNIEFLATYNQKFEDFDVKVQAGSDFFNYTVKSNSAVTVNGLNVPDLYTIDNSVNQPSVSNGRIEEAYRALFGTTTLGYKDLLFVDATLRNDWYSTLPQSNAGVLSKSFGASFIFTDLMGDGLGWLNYGKLRGSWGETPKALGTSVLPFGAYRYPGYSYAVGQYKWNGNFLMGTPDQLVDPNIAGATTNQAEIGLDLAFMGNTIEFSSTYWQGTDKNFPYALNVNGASGFTSILTNIGEIRRKGLEFQLTVHPVATPKFTWDITGTMSALLENKVVELSPEYQVSRISVASVWGSTMPYLVHEEGMRWGQIYGNGIKRINGQPVLDADGYYVNDPDVYFGSALPDYTGGIQNRFRFLENFTLNVNIDYQFGGKFVSLSNMWGSFSGLTARTAATNDNGVSVREPVSEGGGVHVSGVNEEGEPVDYYVEAQDYYHGLYYNKTFDEFIYDLTYVKLRELSLGYNIPVTKLNMSNVIQSANISFVARSPFMIYRTSKDFDPSEIDATVGETGQLPGTRGYGFNLKVVF